MKMKFPFLFKTRNIIEAATTWRWPCTNNPKTRSFRVVANKSINKISNLAFFDDKTNTASESVEALEITDYDDSAFITNGLESDRLTLFEPGQTNSILEQAKSHGLTQKRATEFVVLESNDPFVDFRASMEEMVEAHELLKDLKGLQELLICYLKLNGKNYYEPIIIAFIDLLIAHGFAADSVVAIVDELHHSSF